MFSGIVTEIGSVTDILDSDSHRVISIQAPRTSQKVKLGDSVSLNGCCLTVTQKKDFYLTFDLVYETLEKTNLGFLKKGNLVNLENSLLVGEPIGGHFVQGHVSGTAKIKYIENIGQGKIVYFSYPTLLESYIVDKGYVTIDGMSITVIKSQKDIFSVTFVPHTIQNTITQYYQIGTLVNLEVDILGRYIEKLVRPYCDRKNPE